MEVLYVKSDAVMLSTITLSIVQQWLVSPVIWSMGRDHMHLVLYPYHFSGGIKTWYDAIILQVWWQHLPGIWTEGSAIMLFCLLNYLFANWPKKPSSCEFCEIFPPKSPVYSLWTIWQTFNKIQRLLSKTNGKVVGDLMTPAPLVVRETTNLEDAVRYLLLMLPYTSI